MLFRLHTTLFGLLILVILGCGGGGSSISNPPTLIEGVSYTVAWPERSRGPLFGPSSALSARFVFVGASNNGTDIVSNVNRVAGSGDAYVGSYTLNQAIRSTATLIQATFYSAANQSGEVVATATASYSVNGKTVDPVNFVLTGKVASVAVIDPGLLTTGISGAQLQFVAKDAAMNNLGLSPGSAFWSMQTANGASISESGEFSASNPGTYQVRATVDGVQSPFAPISVGDTGGSLNGGTVLISWPARSRSPIVGLAAALSARIILVNANPAGGDVQFTVDRDISITDAHTATYSISQSISRATASFTANFYSGAAGAGQVVGYASGTVDATGSNLELLNVQTLSAINSLSIVDPGTLTTGTANHQLMVSAKNDSNESVALSSGSIFWTLVSGPAGNALTQDGLFTPYAAGDYRIRAEVDGLVAGPFLITVAPIETDDYNLTAAPNYNGNTQIRAASMNGDGLMVISQTDSNISAVTTWTVGSGLTFIDNSMSALSISNDGVILEVRIISGSLRVGTTQEGGSFTLLPSGGTGETTAMGGSSPMIYPDGSIITAAATHSPALFFADRSSQPIQIPQSNVTNPYFMVPRMNASHQMVAIDKYWSSPTSTPQNLTAPAGSTDFRALAISDNGIIVGTFAKETSEQTHVCRWASANAAPEDLGALPASLVTQITAASVNSSGTIVGTYHGPNPDQEGGWIYTPSLGLRTIDTVVDASADAYQIVGINQVLNNGWIGGFAVRGGYKLAVILRPNP
ncbi:MAG: hypothetical protein KF812_05685 [Fimbriimonadaceae bacterium]|nr:hypothetical protein [Fimbriimonadaceae bacterium]